MPPMENSTMDRKPSPPVTPEMAAEIRFLRQHKKLFNHQIAALFGINQGRVSEVLTGKRFPNVPPAQGSLF
jgi:DNA-binding transcriptional regulator YiaG